MPSSPALEPSSPAVSATSPARWFLLWRNYEEEGCFHRDSGSWIRCDIGKHTELQPCEDITRRYEILPNTTAKYPNETALSNPDRYRVADSISYSSSAGAPASTLSFETAFLLERL